MRQSKNYDLEILSHIEAHPDTTQADLATQLGVAVGTVNWHLKRLIAKGYVKVKRAERKKLRYIITPEGIALRARLTVNYIETSLDLYRRTRRHVRELLLQVKQAGHETVQITGEGDIADICRLTCLEQGVNIAERPANPLPANPGQSPDFPTLEVRGAKVILKLQPATQPSTPASSVD